MELLGDVSLMESRFDPFGDSVGVGPRSVHGLRHTYHWLLGDEAHVEYPISVNLEIVLILTQIGVWFASNVP